MVPPHGDGDGSASAPKGGALGAGLGAAARVAKRSSTALRPLCDDDAANTGSLAGGGCAEIDFLEVDTVVGVGASPGLAGQPCAAERSITALRSTCGGEAVISGSIAGGRGETDFLELDPAVGVGSSAGAAG